MFRPSRRDHHRDVGPPKAQAHPMKTFKNVIFILCVCSLCSKAVMHTWRHFNPAPVAIVGP